MRERRPKYAAAATGISLFLAAAGYGFTDRYAKAVSVGKIDRGREPKRVGVGRGPLNIT